MNKAGICGNSVYYVMNMAKVNITSWTRQACVAKCLLRHEHGKSEYYVMNKAGMCGTQSPLENALCTLLPRNANLFLFKPISRRFYLVQLYAQSLRFKANMHLHFGSLLCYVTL